jgi:hypothetical protein
VLLCEILADKNSDLSDQWENSVSAIKSDLERGQKILDFFAVRLSSNDRSMIVRSEKLSSHILGLSEFVRVARHIMASLYDILCLEVSGGESDSACLEYNKGKFMNTMKCIEMAWHDVSSKALDLGILTDVPALESVDDIRARYLNSESSLDELCRFTLQPLSKGDQRTRSSVTMNGKQYMACSANFMANRLSRQATF